MTKVKWKCSACNGKNADGYGEVTLPICIHCESEVEWDDILTDEQREEFEQRLHGIANN
jgi:hypothetical protein